MLKELKTNKQSSFTNVFDFLKLYDNHFRFKKRISVGSRSKSANQLGFCKHWRAVWRIRIPQKFKDVAKNCDANKMSQVKLEKSFDLPHWQACSFYSSTLKFDSVERVIFSSSLGYTGTGKGLL